MTRSIRSFFFSAFLCSMFFNASKLQAGPGPKPVLLNLKSDANDLTELAAKKKTSTVLVHVVNNTNWAWGVLLENSVTSASIGVTVSPYPPLNEAYLEVEENGYDMVTILNATFSTPPAGNQNVCSFFWSAPPFEFGFSGGYKVVQAPFWATEGSLVRIEANDY